MIITIIAIIAFIILFGIYNEFKITSMMIDQVNLINNALNNYEKLVALAVENNNLSNIENLKIQYSLLCNKIDFFTCLFNVSFIYVKYSILRLNSHNEEFLKKIHKANLIKLD